MPRPIPVRLSTEQKRKLWSLRLSATSQRVWARTTALLMLSGGEPIQAVAKHLGVCINTVTNWKHRWLSRRFFQLHDKARSGRPRRASPRYLRLMQEAVERGPRSFRYAFTVWSARRLAAHLARKTRVDLGEKQVRSWLRRLGFAFRRPKHTLRSRQNPRRVREAKVALEALKKGLSSSPPDMNSGSRTKATSIFILI